MPWVRIDEEFAKHPKVVEAGPLGLAMQVAALCYCNQYLTDGFVPRSVVPSLLNLDGLGMRMWMGEIAGGGEDANWKLVVEDVIYAGLWTEEDSGYRIHDYDKYQPSKAEVEAQRARNKVAGSKGGQARAERLAKQSASHTPSDVASEPLADRLAKAQAKSKPVPVPVTDTTTPPPPPEAEGDLDPWMPAARKLVAEKKANGEKIANTEGLVKYHAGQLRSEQLERERKARLAAHIYGENLAEDAEMNQQEAADLIRGRFERIDLRDVAWAAFKQREAVMAS
jgi:hypothetical protein